MTGISEQSIADFLEYMAGQVIEIDRVFYEKLITESFREHGRGFLFLDVSAFFEKYFTEAVSFHNDCVEHKYVSRSEMLFNRNQNETDRKIVELVDAYDPQAGYVLVVCLNSQKTNSLIARCLRSRYYHLITVGVFCFGLKKPTRFHRSFFRKQLNRWYREGKRLLVFDAQHPDFMGENMELWLDEIRRMRKRGKFFHVTIDSDKPMPADVADDGFISVRIGEKL